VELLLALVALAVGLVALGLVLAARPELARVSRELAEVNQLRSSQLATLEQRLATATAQLEDNERELAEFRAAQAAIPPLPKGRSAGLDDLRERLRAAHSQPDEDDESEA
jgi:hypothetical protein